MAEATTTLVSLETKSGSSQKGPWSFEIYTDAAGQKFQTDFNSDSYRELLNQPVVVVYEEVQRGKFTNKVIQAVQPASNGQSPANGSEAVRTAPVAPQTHPDDLVGKIRNHTIGPLAAAMWSDLPSEERNLENAKRIADALVQWALSNSINF